MVNSLDDLLVDPHLRSVDFWQVREHPSEGMLRHAKVPLQMSGARTDVARLQPQLGEHTREILLECGFAAQRIAPWLEPGGPCHPSD